MLNSVALGWGVGISDKYLKIAILRASLSKAHISALLAYLEWRRSPFLQFFVRRVGFWPFWPFGVFGQNPTKLSEMPTLQQQMF